MAPHITRRRIVVAVVFIPCLLVSSVCAAENTSTLVMSNGNVITGWVKGLDQGKLSFGTDDLGTLSVNWDRVATIVSSRTVLVHMVDGGEMDILSLAVNWWLTSTAMVNWNYRYIVNDKDGLEGRTSGAVLRLLLKLN